jgi:hypothetical protein
MAERPQYYQNTLKPVEVTAVSLAESLEELRVAVRYGAEAIRANETPQDKWPIGGMFKAFPGMYGYRKFYPTFRISFDPCGAELISHHRCGPCFLTP